MVIIKPARLQMRGAGSASGITLFSGKLAGGLAKMRAVI